MDIMFIVLIIPFFVIIYEIYEGEIISRRRYGGDKISRKMQPARFWFNIGLQFVIVTTLVVLYQLGYIEY